MSPSIPAVDDARRSARRPALDATPWALAAAVAAAATLVAAGLHALQPALSGSPSAAFDGDYADVGAFVTWILGDMTEAPFFKSTLAGVAMLGGAALAHWAWVGQRRWRGFDIAYGTGLWPWLTVSALAGLLASNLVWAWTIGSYEAAQPTFVPFVSVPPAVVLLYGPGWRVAATGAVLGTVLTTPIAILLWNEVCVPLELPMVAANTGGMALGAVLAFAICRVLPWMRQPAPEVPDDPTPEHHSHDAAAHAEALTRRPSWAPRRILADFTEPQFYGNEWASAGLLLGVLVAFLINPALPVYGTGLLPEVLASQFLTAAVAVAVWRGRWAAAGWYPSFVPIVSVAPATVLAFGGTVQSIVAGAVLGALAGPPLAAAIAKRLPGDFHPFIGNVASMAICSAAIVPLLRLLPGFDA